MARIRNSDTPRNLRLAVVRDFRDEGWPSMDLCADKLIDNLKSSQANIQCYEIAPTFKRLFGRLPFVSNPGFNCDRLLNRHIFLPNVVRRIAAKTDFVHITDHSYAHVVHAVPHCRAGVYCHDLDAFRSLLEPEIERRPWWFRTLASRTLSGLKKAAVIFYSTQEVRDRLISAQIASSDRLIHAQLGVSEEFTNIPNASSTLSFDLKPPFLLHVGANIPRKRLDILLDVFSIVRTRIPDLRLVQIGGPWPPKLAAQLKRLHLEAFVAQTNGLTRLQLAQVYRQASLVLVTSDAEGFGLPVIEALACGTPVIASDIPTLREAGGSAVSYESCGNISGWADAVTRLLLTPTSAPSLESRLLQAARFSWREHARTISESYLALHAD